MKSKAPLTLMELLIMILVFSMAMALCVRIFVVSDLMSRDSQRVDRAVLMVQNAAETVKHYNGDLEKANQGLAGDFDGETLKLYYDEEGNRVTATDSGYLVTIERTESHQKLLGTADITASIGGEELFELTVAFQEVIAFE